MILGNGSYAVRNSGDGVGGVGEVKVIVQFYFAMDILGLAKRLLGIEDYSPERGGALLTSRGDSSLVVDRLCDQARGQNTAVTCLYFDFGARKEESATNMLSSLVKQMVSGMERIPDEISMVFQEQKRTIGGCGPKLIDRLKITSSKPTFMCIDALDECVGVQWLKVPDSLKQILERSRRLEYS